jgi:hypothetical protein
MPENPNLTPSAPTATSPCSEPVARRHGRGWRGAVLAGAIVALVVAAVLSGCSSTKTSSSTTTTTSASATSTSATYPAGKQEVCQARDQLQSSVKALTDPSLLTQGATAIKAAVTQVQTDLQSVKTAAKQDYEPQITALQTSLQDLQTAAGNLGNGNVAQNMTAVGTAIATVGTDASALLTQLKTSCGS